jgi:hypothetical protein
VRAFGVVELERPGEGFEHLVDRRRPGRPAKQFFGWDEAPILRGLESAFRDAGTVAESLFWTPTSIDQNPNLSSIRCR